MESPKLSRSLHKLDSGLLAGFLHTTGPVYFSHPTIVALHFLDTHPHTPSLLSVFIILQRPGFVQYDYRNSLDSPYSGQLCRVFVRNLRKRSFWKMLDKSGTPHHYPVIHPSIPPTGLGVTATTPVLLCHRRIRHVRPHTLVA